MDVQDAKAVSGYRWTFMKGRGVASYQKQEPGQSRQTILMHNLIAPYLRVSFRNGDKRDCRRKNLVPFDWRDLRRGCKSRKGNVTLAARNFWWHVHRKVIERGQRFKWGTRVCFFKVRTKDEAEAIARNIAKELFAMSRQDFIEFVKHRASKKTTNQIVSDWAVFDGKNLTRWEVFDSGIKATK